MARVAVVAPRSRRRTALVEIAGAGVMEIDRVGGDSDRSGGVAEALRGAPDDVEPRLTTAEPALDALRERDDWDLIAGEVQLSRREADTIEHGPAVIVVGWVPESDVEGFRDRLAGRGVSVVQLPRPRAVAPPTRLPDTGLRQALRPLVRTYAVVPYEDVDPTLFAGITYVLMFGMMFGDVGHGLILAALGVAATRTRDHRLATARRLWLFPVAAGLVAAVFGLLYGEAFGPTGLVPTLWFSPLEQPIRLLAVAVGVGAILVAMSYVLGTVNRWREGGFREALYAQSGIAGVTLFAGAALGAAAVAGQRPGLGTAGMVLVVLGLGLSFAGLKARAGRGGAAVGQATVELFDVVIRIFANVVSFGRLAAFGLTHAAIGFAVWQGATSLWGPGLRAVGAVALFIVGNVVAFALEALVVGVQALRLEYYELFSRIFSGEGRLFEPWHVPVTIEERS
jgi:V/A-type H+-transporting ATPase subunit I